MENALLSEICKKCAQCCKGYSFINLSQNEIGAIERYTGLHFKLFTNRIGKTDEGHFLKFKNDGDCFFLNNNNGIYSCSIYDVRSKICRDYPSNPIQNEVCRANQMKFIGFVKSLEPRDLFL